MSTAGGGFADQVASARKKREGNNASTPIIICVSDDDDNEEETQIVQTKLESLAKTLVKSADSAGDTQRWSSTAVLNFTVQCNACGKWRLMPSKEQYHKICEQVRERPWVCEDARAWRMNASCHEPTDLSENEPDLLWAVDETIIPKPPPGYDRKVVVRGERSAQFADVHYLTPCGQKLWSLPDVARFLDELPKHRREGMTLSQFSFTCPKPGRNVHKRAFKKEGKIWKRVDAERKLPQPAITDGARPSVYLQPLAMLDPTEGPVSKKVSKKASKKAKHLPSAQ